MTYSIIAVDKEAGLIGVAAQSAWLAVGHVVPWVELGVGAVATQAFPNINYGPHGLTLLREGVAPADIVAQLTDADSSRDVRQLAVMNLDGDAAAYTGSSCITYAEHAVGDGVCAQGNILRSAGIPQLMVDAFSNTKGDIFERLLVALETAEAAGGDIRGRQSACISVGRATPTGDPLLDHPESLRVDDHINPVAELRRVVRVRRGFGLLEQAVDQLIDRSDEDAVESAIQFARRAHAQLPDDANVVFWLFLALMRGGNDQEASMLLERSVHLRIPWVDLIARSEDAGLLAGHVDMDRWAHLLPELATTQQTTP